MLTMKQPKSKPPSDAKKRPGRPLHVWLPDDLRDAIDKQAQAEERDLTKVVSRALREYLERHGQTVE